MKFFDEEPKSIDVERAEELAQRLYRKLRENRKVLLGSNVLGFKKKITALSKKVGVEEVEQAVNWYIEHFDEEFVPQIYSANALVSKFDALVRLMDQRDDPKDETIELRNKLQAETLDIEYSYPVEIAALLPLLVQRTRERWLAWRLDSEERREMEFLNNIRFKHSPTFVQDWMVFLFWRYGRMEHYFGSVMGLAFKPSSEAFKKHFWQKWSLEWSGYANTFDTLLENLTKEKP